MKILGNIKKFSFGEMTSNTNGKTSITSVAGGYIVLIGGLSFIMGVINVMFIDKSIDIIDQSVIFTGIGAGLLGVKNFTSAKNQLAEAELNKSGVETTLEETNINEEK
jgi:hypothetical protein